MSREHVFSAGLFREEFVTLVGFPFLNGSTKRLPVNAVVHKCLCKKHNELLSPADEAAIDVANAMRRLSDWGTVRQRSAIKRPTLRELVVDGPGFERWLLKTAITLSRAHPGEARDWNPPLEVRQAAFGMGALPMGCGLAVVAKVGSKLEFGEKFLAAFIRDKTSEQAVAILFNFLGWTFALSWDRPFSQFQPTEVDGVLLERENFAPRVEKLLRADTQTMLRFTWTSRLSSTQRAILEKLRSR